MPSNVNVTSFVVALRPFLVLSKTLGLISIRYTFNSGLLNKNLSNSMDYVCLEFIRTALLINFTYVFHVNNTFYLRELVLFKFWTIIFMSRIYEIWIIRLINGIIEFDEKLDGLALTISVYNPVERSSSTKYGWNIFLAMSLALYIALQIFSMWLWPPSRLDFSTMVKYFFEIPCVTEFTVFVTTYFYLYNLGFRFDTLNRMCEHLPAGLVATDGTCTQSEITETIDRVRLLHSELCDLLRAFGYGYGGVLLSYFAFNFIDLLRNFYYLMHVSRYSSSSNVSSNFHTLNIMLVVLFCLQNVAFVVCLLITVSWINDKKIEIVSFLRLIHISKLPIDTKLQVKMFMNQLSILEWDQFSAFGFFNINVRLIISILILLTTTLATSVQMKEHPYVVKFNKAYQSYLQFEYNMR